MLLTCYPRIMLRLVYLNKVSRMCKFEIVTINYRNQLSGLKDSPDPVGRLKFDARPDKVDRSPSSVKNNYSPVQTSTMIVNKAPSCLDCPTPSSVQDDDKNRRIGQVLCQRGQVPVILPPVVTQSFARETLLNQPDILVWDLVDLPGSSPPVAQVKNLRLLSVTDPSTKISTVNNDKFMVSVHENLGASCSFRQSLLHKGSTETGVMVTSPNVFAPGARSNRDPG